MRKPSAAVANPEFTGFPAGTQTFLRGLAANNAKSWFDDHRDDYEQFYIEPAKAFVAALGPKLKKITPGVQFEPRVNGSIMRINRDVRFSKDKSPYKTNLDLWFWTGKNKGWDMPGYFLRVQADRVILGAGMHHLMGPQLDAFRRAVDDAKQGAAAERVIQSIRKSGDYAVHGESRKSVPRGYAAGHPRATLLKHEGLWAALETKSPAELRSPKFVDFCVRHFKAMAPLNDWLETAIASEG